MEEGCDQPFYGHILATQANRVSYGYNPHDSDILTENPNHHTAFHRPSRTFFSSGCPFAVA